ncbi:hypothetical protein T440DRAFT_540300 [Plenodomus tracheiphilus IPT5]|uniref:DUF6594 domain-containing protein n=1 Tax=Plenodomus tracheiphilus IPT5 TaxID=1408161 RepID=A0A6A7AXK1_9PLEO|nr:hypothetical protein T440DRAFT_540300 [Plenodomus tracheiphilus IPT5]
MSTIGDSEKNESIISKGTVDVGNNAQSHSIGSTTVNTFSNCSSWVPAILLYLWCSTITRLAACKQQRKEAIASYKKAEAETKSLITVPLQNYPRGYPRQAAFQASEHSFSIYRGFDYLHSRVILEMQDELRCLEENLQELDESDNNPERSRCLSSRAFDLKQSKRDGKHCSERATLLSTIRDKLVNYDEVLMKAREINAFQRPSRRDYRSVRRWLFNVKPISYVREAQYIKKREDLVTLRHGREWAGFDGWIEECIHKLPAWLSRPLFTTQELRDKSDDDCIYYYSPSRIEKLVGFIITLIIFILLVLPVVAMYELTSVGKRTSTFDAVGILVVFTMLFCAAMSLLTKAKRHELFAASAAYCAVLVVFISNFKND